MTRSRMDKKGNHDNIISRTFVFNDLYSSKWNLRVTARFYERQSASLGTVIVGDITPTVWEVSNSKIVLMKNSSEAGQ